MDPSDSLRGLRSAATKSPRAAPADTLAEAGAPVGKAARAPASPRSGSSTGFAGGSGGPSSAAAGASLGAAAPQPRAPHLFASVDEARRGLRAATPAVSSGGGAPAAPAAPGAREVPAARAAPAAPEALRSRFSRAILLVAVAATFAGGITAGTLAARADPVAFAATCARVAPIAASAAAATPLVFAAANALGFWHIGNAASTLVGRRWRVASLYGATSQLRDENALYTALATAAGVAFDASFDEEQRLALWPQLAASPMAIIGVARQVLAPWVAEYVYAQAAELTLRPWRAFVVSTKALPVADVAAADAADWSLEAVRRRTGALERQSPNAYEKGFVATPDLDSDVSERVCARLGLSRSQSLDTAVPPPALVRPFSPPAAAAAAAAAAPPAVGLIADGDPVVHVPYLLFAVLAWQLGYLPLALHLWGLAFPGAVFVNWGMFVGGHAWAVFIFGNEIICLVLVLVSVLTRKVVASHTNARKGAASYLRVGIGGTSVYDADNEAALDAGADVVARVPSGGLAGELHYGEAGGDVAQRVARGAFAHVLGVSTLAVAGGQGRVSGLALAAVGGLAGLDALAAGGGGGAVGAAAAVAAASAAYSGFQSDAGASPPRRSPSPRAPASRGARSLMRSGCPATSNDFFAIPSAPSHALLHAAPSLQVRLRPPRSPSAPLSRPLPRGGAKGVRRSSRVAAQRLTRSPHRCPSASLANHLLLLRPFQVRRCCVCAASVRLLAATRGARRRRSRGGGGRAP